MNFICFICEWQHIVRIVHVLVSRLSYSFCNRLTTKMYGNVATCNAEANVVDKIKRSARCQLYAKSCIYALSFACTAGRFVQMRLCTAVHQAPATGKDVSPESPGQAPVKSITSGIQRDEREGD
jgi:hypothetical protein